MELAEIRSKLKRMLIENLSLEGMSESDIADDEILFGEGLGLDSLDAVEIVVLLQRHFGVEINNIDEAREIFASMDSLARYVQQKTAS